MAGDNLENLIVPSSSTDENPSFTTPSAYLMRKQPIEMSKKRKLKEAVPVDVVNTSLEEEEVSGPHMTKQEFETCYPHVNLGLKLVYPFNDMSGDAKDMVRDCMVFISPEEVYEMEAEWRKYHREEAEHNSRQNLQFNEQSKLIEKATRAYIDSLKK